MIMKTMNSAETTAKTVPTYYLIDRLNCEPYGYLLICTVDADGNPEQEMFGATTNATVVYPSGSGHLFIQEINVNPLYEEYWEIGLSYVEFSARMYGYRDIIFLGNSKTHGKDAVAEHLRMAGYEHSAPLLYWKCL